MRHSPNESSQHRPARAFDTLFGRMAVFATLVLFAVQLGWFAVFTIQRPRNAADGYARGLLLVIQAAQNVASNALVPSPMPGVNFVPAQANGSHPEFIEPETDAASNLLLQVREGLPSGSDVHMSTKPNLQMWIRYPASGMWIVLPLNPPPSPPFFIESLAMLLAAILLSLGAAWQMQRPMSRVANVARRFGKGERPPELTEEGPREVRDLIYAVNQMMQQISASEDEKALMLAGIAHDLKAPLTRLKLRASVLDDDAERAHFIRDVDSLTHIVQQFLEFAGSETTDGPDVAVDHFVAEQFSTPVDSDLKLFVHRLHAGPEFALPRTLVDRLTTNLVDNAIEHGEPPIEIATFRQGDEWVLEVRDHGIGIPDALIEEASKPFARLDPARSGDGHCGLGLAIVQRLARKKRGRCELTNATNGGLCVRILLPVSPAAVPATAAVPTAVAEPLDL